MAARCRSLICSGVAVSSVGSSGGHLEHGITVSTHYDPRKTRTNLLIFFLFKW